MPELVLVKLPDGKLRGWTDEDEKAYQKFKAELLGLVEGECIRFEWKRDRNSKFHRKMFALLRLGFDHWVPDRKRFTYRGKPIEKDFDNFRKSITIQAGFFKQVFDIDGRMELQAESLAYDKMDEERFEKCFSAVANVLLERVLTNYQRADLDRVVNELMGFTQ